MPEVNYFWDEIEDNVVREYDENNNTIANYTTEPTLYGAVLTQDRNGEVRHYHYDGQGNTTELTDNAGNVTDMRRYSAFGEIVAQSGITEMSLQWMARAGYYHVHEISLIYQHARHYSPPSGRWTGLAPFGGPLALNGYAYRYGSVLNHANYDLWPPRPWQWWMLANWTCARARRIVVAQMNAWRALGNTMAADLLELFLNDASERKHDMSRYCPKFMANNGFVSDVVEKGLSTFGIPEACFEPMRATMSYTGYHEFLPLTDLMLDAVDGSWDDLNDIQYACGSVDYTVNASVVVKPGPRCCCIITASGSIKIVDAFWFHQTTWTGNLRLLDDVWLAGWYLLNFCNAPSGGPYVEPRWEACCQLKHRLVRCPPRTPGLKHNSDLPVE